MCEISIVVPVYNKKTYIRDTINSILNQTFNDYELILIDDGSSDGTEFICDELSFLDKRITVYHTDNKGVGAARNLGIKKSKGTYICFIDADDYVDNTFLEKLYSAIISNNAGVSVCGYYEIKEGNCKNYLFKEKHSSDCFYDVLTNDVLCVIWNKLFVRENIKHLFDENILTSEDSIFCARYYFDNIPKIAYVEEILYGYTVYNDGLSSNYQESSMKGTNKFLAINRRISELINDDNLKKKAIFHIYKVYFYGIYTFIFENISKAEISEENLSIISTIISDKKYKRVLKYITRYSIAHKKESRISKSEFCYLVFSLFKMEKMIFIFPKVKRWIKARTSH